VRLLFVALLVGKRKGKSSGKNEIQGFLHCGGKCAAFGRNDVGFLEWVGESRQRQVQPQIPALRCGMTNKRAGNGKSDCNCNSESDGNG
jgi:hypothetical protein